jgi:Flp pilus assembly protein TadG
MLLVLPVFLVLLLAFVELTSIVLVEERLAAASIQGARVASQGGTLADVQAAVDNYFGPGTLKDNYVLNLTQNTTATASAISETIDPTLVSSGQPVRVIVKVEAGKVVPDLLRLVGFELSDHVLVGQTVLRKE